MSGVALKAATPPASNSKCSGMRRLPTRENHRRITGEGCEVEMEEEAIRFL